MRKRRLQAGAHIYLIALSLIYIVPIWLMIVTSLRDSEGGIFRDWQPFKLQALLPYDPDISGYQQVFQEGAIFRTALFNTLIVCAVVIVVGTAINLLAGFAFAYFRFPGRNLLFVVCLVTFMVPFEGIVIPLLSMMQALRLVDTLAAVIVPTLASGFVIFLFRQFFLGVPRELAEAAMIDGAGTLRILIRIYVPLSRPVVITSCIVLFIAQWQALFLPFVLLRSPDNWLVQLALSSMQGSTQLPTWGPVLAGATIILLIPIVLVAPFMRYFKLSLFEGANRG